jgi:hypothetical protein
LRKSIKNANFIDAKQLINVKFLILKIYKGHFESDTITILTGINGAMCGYTSFEKNKAYIVYGFSKRNVPISISLNAIVENKNTIWTTHCTRTTDNVEPEIIELNKLKRKAFVAQLRGDLSHKKYVWSEDKADIPKAVFDYLNAWKLKNTNEKHGFTIVNPKEEYDCCCTTDHALPPRQLIKIAKKDNQWIIVYWHGQGIVTNEKILCLNLDEKDEVSFFNFNTEVKTKNIQQSIFLQIKNENLCLFNGDSSGCPYFSDF